MPDLFLSELTLSHFRSHKHLHISLDGRPVALFGANGSGKTNILEAVSMLSPGRGLRRAGTNEIARKPEALGWKVAAVLHSLGALHEIETRASGSERRTVHVDGKLTPQLRLGSLARMVWLIPSMDRLWLEGAEGRRRFLDRLTLSFEPGHADAALVYEKAMRERNRLLKDMVRDPMWYAALERQMAEAGAQVIGNRAMTVARLQEAMQGSISAFPVAQLSIEAPDDAGVSADTDLLLAALEGSRPLDLRAGRTLVGPHRADLLAIYTAKNVLAKNCSTGEQKALLLSLVLANARALAEDFGTPPILLLDEVAAHLDEGRRAALYDEISGLGAQAIMTGTGAELFEAMGQRAQRFEVEDEDGCSRVTPR